MNGVRRHWLIQRLTQSPSTSLYHSSLFTSHDFVMVTCPYLMWVGSEYHESTSYQAIVTWTVSFPSSASSCYEIICLPTSFKWVGVFVGFTSSMFSCGCVAWVLVTAGVALTVVVWSFYTGTSGPHIPIFFSLRTAWHSPALRNYVTSGSVS